MNCLIVQPIHEAGLARLRAAGITPVACPDARMATVARMLPGMTAAITRDAGFSAEAFAAADGLRVVAVHGSGHDAVDKAAATEKGVLVANAPGLNARSVAELAVGLAVAASRGIAAGDAAERAGAPGFRYSRSFGELFGKTALIVGWGRIGRMTGEMLVRGFGMQVLVWSPRAPETGGFARPATLAEGLAAADLVSLHTPMSPATRHMIDARSLAGMKPGAVLVNTARAGLVDEEALAAALEEGRIAGAGLDVYSDAAPAGRLGRAPGAIFTPHLGATTEEALIRVALASAEHVITALAGGIPETALNAAALAGQGSLGG
ncbi:NAD(P)-dependent oxidoreductase [Mangrovicoccus algicola]|uniref:3-phosphoglycerate dehydrogenase n=1 Tax=Mangrovicoccus algicola TaxID=2771008 RepID=A0A8J7CZP0_9RHOB|nr:NAD(P)-dependent oxidoreductase [Mangrovicoccus algicola]MBE3638188.1 3-phosphoglycerate dehydrogenase [Mangrovicoccus algicola]